MKPVFHKFVPGKGFIATFVAQYKQGDEIDGRIIREAQLDRDMNFQYWRAYSADKGWAIVKDPNCTW